MSLYHPFQKTRFHSLKGIFLKNKPLKVVNNFLWTIPWSIALYWSCNLWGNIPSSSFWAKKKIIIVIASPCKRGQGQTFMRKYFLFVLWNGNDLKSSAKLSAYVGRFVQLSLVCPFLGLHMVVFIKIHLGSSRPFIPIWLDKPFGVLTFASIVW